MVRQHRPDDGFIVPVVIDPCGDVHASIEDFALFAQLHLQALHGHYRLLGEDSFRFLHEPVGNYACGWSIGAIEGQKVSRHYGSCDTFMAVIAVSHDSDIAVVAATNIGDKIAEKGCNEVVARMLAAYGE